MIKAIKNLRIIEYRSILLLPIISKFFEKLFLKRLQPFHPISPFGFRIKYSMIDQVYRITNIIKQAQEEKEECPAVFNKVWTNT